MRRILKDGLLILPDDYLILESLVTPEFNYAAVVAVRNWVGMPHYIIPLERPYQDLTWQEKDDLFEIVYNKVPILREIASKHITPIRDDTGLIINAVEVDRSPDVGIFPISECADEDNLFCGTGIIRSMSEEK